VKSWIKELFPCKPGFQAYRAAASGHTDNIYMQAVNDGAARRSGDLLLPLTQAEKAEEGCRGTFDIGVRLT
jgi:hypothetical protein